MEKKISCPVCTTEIFSYPNYDRNTIFYICPVCGRYELAPYKKLNFNHLAPYLAYNGFKKGIAEYRYHTILDKEICDKYRKEFDAGNNTHGRPVHMDADIIDNWYPKTFSERIDMILIHIYSRTKHIGQQIPLSYQEMLSILFIDRQEFDKSSGIGSWKCRELDDCEREVKYMLNYLTDSSYAEYVDGMDDKAWIYISLSPKGYARVDELQKYSAHGHNVLVAMKFGDDTKPLREAIRQGISDAGYHAVFIDEVQHNDFITPELLKYIRDSKFVVVDLTHQNNGAYFEEGYAMGLGKPVIQLCKADTKLHFDIAQKNTIIWQSEEEIPIRLCNRIKATID